MTKTKNQIEFTDKQAIAVFDFLTKNELVNKVATTEENDPKVLLPDEYTEEIKIFFGRTLYKVLTNKFPSSPIDENEAICFFNAFAFEYPKSNEAGKEVAEMLLEAAPTKEEQIALGRILWELISAFKEAEESKN